MAELHCMAAFCFHYLPTETLSNESALLFQAKTRKELLYLRAICHRETSFQIKTTLGFLKNGMSSAECFEWLRFALPEFVLKLIHSSACFCFSFFFFFQLLYNCSNDISAFSVGIVQNTLIFSQLS